jgi:hypothetical protein
MDLSVRFNNPEIKRQWEAFEREHPAFAAAIAKATSPSATAADRKALDVPAFYAQLSRTAGRYPELAQFLADLLKWRTASIGGTAAKVLSTSPKVVALKAGTDIFIPADVIDVRGFDATGDGLTDDTAAIQKALDAACAIANTLLRGAQVVFPPGVYLVSGPLRIGTNQVPQTPGSVVDPDVVGRIVVTLSPAATIEWNWGPNDGAVISIESGCGGGPIAIEGGRITTRPPTTYAKPGGSWIGGTMNPDAIGYASSDIAKYGPAIAVPGIGQAAVTGMVDGILVRASWVTIRGVVVDGFTRNGIRFEGPVEGCCVQDATISTNGGEGIYSEGGARRLVLSRNRVEGNGDAGMTVKGGVATSIVDNLVRANGTAVAMVPALRLDGTGGGGSAHAIVSANRIEHDGEGGRPTISFDAGVEPFGPLVVAGNHVSSRASEGICVSIGVGGSPLSVQCAVVAANVFSDYRIGIKLGKGSCGHRIGANRWRGGSTGAEAVKNDGSDPGSVVMADGDRVTHSWTAAVDRVVHTYWLAGSLDATAAHRTFVLTPAAQPTKLTDLVPAERGILILTNMATNDSGVFSVIGGAKPRVVLMADPMGTYSDKKPGIGSGRVHVFPADPGGLMIENRSPGPADFSVCFVGGRAADR